MGDTSTVKGVTTYKKNLVSFAFHHLWCKVPQTEIWSMLIPPNACGFLVKPIHIHPLLERLPMKKATLLVCLIVCVSLFSLGCTISSPTEWCRRGSIWPFSKPAQETVMPAYTYMGSSNFCPPPCDPCATIDPCADMGGQSFIMPNAGNPYP